MDEVFIGLRGKSAKSFLKEILDGKKYSVSVVSIRDGNVHSNVLVVEALTKQAAEEIAIEFMINHYGLTKTSATAVEIPPK